MKKQGIDFLKTDTINAVKSAVTKFGTPSYFYSQSEIESRLFELKQGLDGTSCSIHFAVKSCSNLSILNLLKNNGCGGDIVSGGELYRCLKAGINPQDIVFSGVGKTQEEIAYALNTNIGAFNVESIDELNLIAQEARAQNKSAVVRFRINPNVDAKTHPYISTGLKKNKFGLNTAELHAALALLPNMKNVIPQGLSCHIGSQITSLAPLKQAWLSMAKTALTMPFPVKALDLGGGLGIRYKNERISTLSEYGAAISTFSKQLIKLGLKDIQLSIEPGRSLIGASGFLVTKVTAIKKRTPTHIAVVDAGMNDLLRPALYGAHHTIRPLKKSTPTQSYVVVGPVCESADVFLNNVKLPKLNTGDLLAIMDAGAYGMSMASNYNSRPKPVELLITKAGQTKLICKRESMADLIKSEEEFL